MKLDLVIRQLHRAERDLSGALFGVADRHKVEHEVHHVATDLAGWSQEHVHQLADVGERFGLHLADEAPEDTGPFGTVVAKLSELTGTSKAPALLLLADLRRLHLKATEVSVDWTLLGQGAQAAKDVDVLALTSRCHPQTLRQVKWMKSMLKILSPQTLAS